MASGHFRMKIATVWRPVLLAFGGIQSNSFVDVTDEVVHFHFGFVFDRTVARDDVESVTRRDWPWWMGVGWRSDLRGLIGLIGSHDDVVEVKLKGRQRAWGFVFPVDRIAVSLEKPDEFIAELTGAAPEAKPRKSTPAAKPKKDVSAPKTRRAPAKTRRQPPKK